MRSAIFALLLIGVSHAVLADYLITNRNISIKGSPAGDSEILFQAEADATLILLDNGRQVNGYYHISYSGQEGYVYRTFVKRYRGNPAGVVISTPATPAAANPTLDMSYTPTASSEDKVISHDGFVSCMSTEFNVPMWVFQKVSYALLQGPSRQRPNSYPQDAEYPLLKAKAYTGSGYDHGHLAPAADFKRDADLYNESFLMTNMAPQHGCFNQKGWCLLESNVRDWAIKNPASEFLVFSGSIIDEHVQDWLCLNNVTITVPSAFYKIVVETKNGAFVKGVAFIMPNGDINGNDVEATRTTIDEVERVTGLNFFPRFSPAVESRIEQRAGNFTLTDLRECANRNKPCESVYGSRTFPEDRTVLVCEE